MTASTLDFSYDIAFARNTGLVTAPVQERLRKLRVGLAGLGGVGGSHLQALARLGVGGFHLADLDTFELVNFNRQIGATMDSIGRPKIEVMAAVARSINPEAEIRCFDRGIQSHTMNDFLAGLDVVVDGLEFFAIEVRRALYVACRKAGIPVINAGPIGYGASIVVFTGQSISFEQFTHIDDSLTRTEQLLAFGLAMNPKLTSHVDPKSVDVLNQKGPAVSSACFLCSALAAQEVLKQVSGTGDRAIAPHGKYFDLQRHRVYRLRGTPHLRRSWLGRLIRTLAFRRMPQMKAVYLEELQRQRQPQSASAVTRPV